MNILDPIVVEKPWGMRPHLIKWSTGIGVPNKDLVGELWIASGLKSLADKANPVSGTTPRVTIADIVSKDPQKFLGGGYVPSKKLSGKTEAWYVRDVKGDVRTITGLKDGIGKKEFKKLVSDGFFNEKHDFEKLEEEIFTTERFKRNAFYILLPGTLHTIYAPDKDSYIVIDEIQQGYGDNALPILSKILFISDSALSIQVHPSSEDVAKEKRGEIIEQYKTEPTIRVYDFGRGRKSQPELAAELIHYEKKGFIKTTPVVTEPEKGCKVTYLGATKYFARELIELHRNTVCSAHSIGSRFNILHCVDGEGTISWEGEEKKITRGQTYAMSAKASPPIVETQKGLICYRDYVPDLDLLKKTLKSNGASDDDIRGMIVDTD